jgi:hypothetical protein
MFPYYPSTQTSGVFRALPDARIACGIRLRRALDRDREACTAASGAALKEGGDFGSWHGSREVEALAAVGAGRGQFIVLVDRFDAFGYDGHALALGKVNDFNGWERDMRLTFPCHS